MRRVGRRNDDEAGGGDGFAHDDPVVDEALEWFARRRNTSLDAATQAAFARWLAASHRHAEEYARLEALWGSTAFLRAAETLRPAPAARGIPAAARAPRRWTVRALAAAAVILVAIGAWQGPALVLRWQADYRTETGDRREVRLPDGSSMLLDTASAVAIDFRDGRRQVTLLQGAAFFDVTHDPAHPFRVAGRFGETEVRGTAFAVRTDPAEDRVILERGHVRVSRLADRADRADLGAGQMVVASRDALSAVAAVDLGSRLAWREGRIVFADQPLSRVLDELRRYYRGTVFVADDRINRLIVTGNYRLDHVEGAIRTLADAAGVTMNRLPGGFIILR
jgi:transmembrane sensor